MEQPLLHFVLRTDAINDLQLNSMRRVIRRANQAHMTDIDMRINGKNERSEADWLKHLREVVPGDVATSTGHAAEEAQCVHLCLDDRRVPRTADNGETLSLWGRVCEYLRMHAPAAVNACCAESQNELTKEKS